MSCTRDDVIAELERADRPVSSNAVAARLHRSSATVSSILSKLAMYGSIERVRVPAKGRGRAPMEYLYSMKAAQP